MADTDTEAKSAADRKGFRKPRKPRRWTFLLCVVGTIVAYAAMLAARGNGWSPLAFVALGLIGTPVLARVLVRRKPSRPWAMRGLALLLIAGVSFGLAKFSTRIDPAQAYTDIFHSPPPPGVTLLQARTQWHDGKDEVVSFTASAGAMDALVKSQPLEEKSPLKPSPELIEWAVGSPFLDLSDLLPPSPVRWRHWAIFDSGLPTGDVTTIDILWDESTGRGIVRGGWH